MLVFLWVHRRFQLDWYYSVPSFHRLSYVHSRLSSLNSLDSASYCQFLVKILFLWFLKKGKTSTPRKNSTKKGPPPPPAAREPERTLINLHNFVQSLRTAISQHVISCNWTKKPALFPTFGNFTPDFHKFCLTVKPWLRLKRIFKFTFRKGR